MADFVFFIFLILCFLTTPILSRTFSSKQQEKGLVINLIHRNKLDPFIYPPNSTRTEKLDYALSRVTRTTRYTAIANQTPFPEKPIAFIYGKGSTFLLSIWIGTQKTPQYVTMDTGSTYLWVQCINQENGHRTGNPLYDPVDSKDHKMSTCLPSGDHYCKKVARDGHSCDNQNRCEYFLEYQDTSHSKGFVVFDTLTFFQNDRENAVPVENVFVGCGLDNFNINTREDGVFGLGPDPDISILGQTGMKFSFCIGDIADERYPFNILALGVDARIIGDEPEHLIIDHDEYHVKFNRFLLGPHEVPMPDDFTLMIDSGSTMSYLEPHVFDRLVGIVDEVIEGRVQKVSSSRIPQAVCYDKLDTILGDFPILYAEFTTEAMRIFGDSLFWKIPEENLHCMTFLPTSDEDEPNILGAATMQHHNVGFDLDTNLVYFQRMDCKDLLP